MVVNFSEAIVSENIEYDIAGSMIRVLTELVYKVPLLLLILNLKIFSENQLTQMLTHMKK